MSTISVKDLRIGTISDALENYALGDGIGNVSTDKAISFGSLDSPIGMNDGGLLYGKNVKIVPHVLEVKVNIKQDDEDKELILEYIHDPIGQKKYYMAKAMLKEGSDGQFEEISNIDELNLPFLNPNAISPSKVSGLANTFLSCLTTDKETKEKGIAFLGSNKNALTAVMQIQKAIDGKANRIVVTTDNIKIVAESLQAIYDELEDGLKEVIDKKISTDEYLSEPYKLLKNATMKKITKEDILKCDFDNLYILSQHDSALDSDYRYKTDKSIAKEILKHKEIVKVDSKVINYTAVMNIKGGHVLENTIASITPDDKTNGYAMKKSIDSGKLTEKFGKMLTGNVEKLQKNLAAPKDGIVMPGKLKQNLQTARALADYMNKALKAKILYPSYADLPENISKEDKSKEVVKRQKEVSKNQASQQALKHIAYDLFVNYVKAFENSDVISSSLKYQLAIIVKYLDKIRENQGINEKNYKPTLDGIKKAITATIVQFKHKEDFFLRMISNENIQPTMDGSRFPQKSSHGSRGIDYLDFVKNSIQASKDGEELFVINAYAARIQNNSDHTDENPSHRLGANIVPLFYYNKKTGDIIKANPIVSKQSNYAYKLQKFFNNCDKDENFKAAKAEISSILKSINGESAFLKSKVFCKTTYSELMEGIASANSSQALSETVCKSAFLASAKNIPDISPLVLSSKFLPENVQQLLKGDERTNLSVSEKDKFPSNQILSSLFVKETISSTPEGDYFKTSAGNDYSEANAFRVFNKIRGSVVTTKTEANGNKKRIISSFFGADTPKKEGIQILQEATEEAYTIPKQIIEEVKKEYPAKEYSSSNRKDIGKGIKSALETILAGHKSIVEIEINEEKEPEMPEEPAMPKEEMIEKDITETTIAEKDSTPSTSQAEEEAEEEQTKESKEEDPFSELSPSDIEETKNTSETENKIDEKIDTVQQEEDPFDLEEDPFDLEEEDFTTDNAQEDVKNKTEDKEQVKTNEEEEADIFDLAKKDNPSKKAFSSQSQGNLFDEFQEKKTKKHPKI